jgi:2-dehydro-3-deoxyphosphogalactonate aldolase
MAANAPHQRQFEQAFAATPLIAILRGLRPDEAVAIGEALVSGGITILEVPLNSPAPLDSIARLRAALGERAVVGAGTVMTTDEAAAVADAGGQLIVAPNCDVEVIAISRARGLVSAPGVATPSEAFQALRAGAHALKLFPAEMLPPVVVKAWRAVLPGSAALIPVGGITPDTMDAYLKAGASGFGIGSALYKPGVTPEHVHDTARTFVAAVRRH